MRSRARRGARHGGEARARGGRPAPGRVLAGLARAFAIAGLVLAGCAKKEPPSGGPPDIEQPRLVSSTPDSGQAGVPVDVRPTLTFSEGMEPRATGEAVSFAPPLEIRQRRWHGRTLTLVLAKPLQRDRTYTMFVSGTARDRHGNDYGTGKTVVFSTGASFPPGLISGRVEARGFTAGGSYLWVYDQGQGHAPDSSARDFDALGLAQDDGSFAVAGLKVPGRYRLWAFVDLNGNRSFEPSTDILAPIDTTFELTAESPHATGVQVRVVNPRSPGTVSGTVLDSLRDSTGVLHVLAVAVKDSTKHVLVEADKDGSFQLRLDRGTWRIRAFRDLNSDRSWQPARERASDLVSVEVEAAGLVSDLKLTLRPAPGGP